jgi:hypothetical protein
MSNVPSTDTDPWDRPEWRTVISARAYASEPQDAGGTGVPARQKAPVPIRAIPDHWDDDPSSSDEEDSQKIWEDAYVIFPPSIAPRAEWNTHCCRNKAGPMPELVLGSTQNVLPPASAFQSPVRILKRSSQKHTNASPSASATAETFAERSARYNAARERIFADTAEGKVGDGEGGAASLVIRNPKGPGHSPGPNREGSHGFAERVASQRGDS